MDLEKAKMLRGTLKAASHLGKRFLKSAAPWDGGGEATAWPALRGGWAATPPNFVFNSSGVRVWREGCRRDWRARCD